MKVRLSMSGHDSTGRVSFKRTLSEQEFAMVALFVLDRNLGTAPGRRSPSEHPPRTTGRRFVPEGEAS